MIEVNLYKIKGGWAIKAGTEVESYTTVEKAADILLSLGVKDEAIDVALIEIHANAHSRANFGMNGTFIMSDGAKLNEPIGSA